MIKVLTIIGSRPEGIKMAPVVRMLQQDKRFNSLVCVTAQHREMLDQVLELFKITPDVDLDLMRPKQTPLKVISAICDKLPSVLEKHNPAWVLVQGDTSTVLAASLVAFHMKIRIGHVEAGLRTNNKKEPFPEEINRRVAGVLADIHFAPTEEAKNNLLGEGVKKNIIVSGNTVIDAQKLVLKMPQTSSGKKLLRRLGLNDQLKEKPRTILVTAHRRENFGKPLINICEALKDIAQYYGDRVNIVYPVHLNPNVKQIVQENLKGINNIILTQPLDYITLTNLMNSAYLIITDSGGIQEEAPSLGVPVLVTRNVTERMEGVKGGTAKLVGTDKKVIVKNVKELMSDSIAYNRMSKAENPFGDGKASERILEALLQQQYK